MINEIQTETIEKSWFQEIFEKLNVDFKFQDSKLNLVASWLDQIRLSFNMKDGEPKCHVDLNV